MAALFLTWCSCCGVGATAGGAGRRLGCTIPIGKRATIALILTQVPDVANRVCSSPLSLSSSPCAQASMAPHLSSTLATSFARPRTIHRQWMSAYELCGNALRVIIAHSSISQAHVIVKNSTFPKQRARQFSQLPQQHQTGARCLMEEEAETVTVECRDKNKNDDSGGSTFFFLFL